jgi:peptidoglycan/xylan/chitin deacetylase (PgdA/CDA1 family)
LVSEAVPVLMYHSLDERGSVLSTAPENFRRQMDALRSRGFRGLGLGELLDAWDRGAALPPRPVVLTFDDGFRSVLDQAAPILAGLGFGATIFAVASHCGGQNDWPSQPAGIPTQPLLSGPDLRDLAAQGFEIGAHGATHAPLDSLGPATIEEEVGGSKRRLEDIVGQPVTLFAYPYGLGGPAARAAARTHYRAACSTDLRVARAGDDRHWIGRIDMYYFRSPWILRIFGTRLGEAYLGLRRLGRGARRLSGARS